MISWLIIGILVISAVIALKMNHLRHRVWIIMVIIFALFIYTSIAVVYSQNQLEVNSTEGFMNSAKIYFGWLGNGFQNVRSLTGNAVKMDWKATNGTLLNITKEK